MLSQWYSGVVRHKFGSKIMSREPIPECKKPCLWFVLSSVPPAREKYSPPDRLVGIVMSGTVGSDTRRGMFVLSTEYRVSSSGVEMLFARHYHRSAIHEDKYGERGQDTKTTSLHPSVILPAPNVTTQSTPFSLHSAVMSRISDQGV